jgi:GGDEF domain-containing protein
MNKNSVQNQDINIALFVVWSIIASGSIVYFDRQLFILGLALLVMIEIFTITKIIDFAWLVSLIIASVIYWAAYYSIYPFGLSTILQPGIVNLIFIITALIGVMVTNTLSKIFGRLQTDVQILTDLMQYDSDTGLLRWQYMHQKLNDELARSRRYNKKFSIVMIEPANTAYDRADDEKRREINQTMARLIMQTCRTNVDIPFSGKAFGVILPETDAEGSVNFARRLVIHAAHKELLDLRIAIAAFPDDAVTIEEMIHACETTLRMAMTSGETILRYDATQLSKKSAEETAENYNPGGLVQGTKKIQQLMENKEPDEYLLIVHEFYHMADLSLIQSMLADIADIQDVQILEYTEGQLIFKIKSDAVLSESQFVNFKELNFKNLQFSGKLIEIEMG